MNEKEALAAIPWDNTTDTHEVPGFGRVSGHVIRRGIVYWSERGQRWVHDAEFVRDGDTRLILVGPGLRRGDDFQ